MARKKKNQAGSTGRPLSTEPPTQPAGKLKLARAGRQATLGVLAAFVGLGIVGMWGSRSSVVSASSGGIELSVRYPAVTRSGMPVEWQMEVHRKGGFEGPVVLATSLDFLDLFDVNDLQPQPSSSHTNGGMLIWEFDPPDGDTLLVSVDAVAEATIHWGRTSTTSVLIDAAPTVTVRYRTRVMP